MTINYYKNNRKKETNKICQTVILLIFVLDTLRVLIHITCNYTSYEFKKHVISGNIIFLTRSFPSMLLYACNYQLSAKYYELIYYHFLW